MPDPSSLAAPVAGLRPVALITGASSGIGAAATRVFAEAGYDLAISARRADRLEALALELRGRHTQARIEAIVCDVTFEASVASMFERVKERFGRLDVLVNNAGFGGYGSVAEMSVDSFRAVMETNYFGVLLCTKAALPLLRATATIEQNRRNRWGATIVMVSSCVGRRSFPGATAYCASKFAVEGLSEGLRTELHDERIAVSVVNPGLTRTEFFDSARGIRPSHFLAPETSGMSSEDVARVILRAARRPRRNWYLTWAGKMGIFAQWLAPTLVDRVLVGTWRKSK